MGLIVCQVMSAWGRRTPNARVRRTHTDRNENQIGKQPLELGRTEQKKTLLLQVTQKGPIWHSMADP